MSDFNDKIRLRLTKHIESSKETWHGVATKLEITPQIIYNFRSGGGLNSENAYKLIQYLDIKESELLEAGK